MSAKIKIAILCLVAANIIWGASYPIYKWSLENVPPFTFAFLRFFLASFLLLPFVRHQLVVKREDIRSLVTLSFFGITFGISLMFLGLQRAESINAPIINAAGPILLLFSSMFFLHEKPKKQVVIGMICSLIGVLCIFIEPLFTKGLDPSFLGNLFLILATCGGVIHTIHMKKIISRYNPLTLTFWSFVIGSLPLIPFVFYESIQQGGFLTTLNTQGVIGILFGVIFASAIAHTMNSEGIKYLSATESGVFIYINPIAAVLIAVPLLGEKVTPFYILSALLVFLGVFIAEERFKWLGWKS